MYMYDIVDDLYKLAADYMQQGGLRLDEDFVGKLQDIYLWCSICESKTAGVWGCPILFTSGCCAGIYITKNGMYLTLQFCGAHHPRCHDALLTSCIHTQFCRYLTQTSTDSPAKISYWISRDQEACVKSKRGLFTYWCKAWKDNGSNLSLHPCEKTSFLFDFWGENQFSLQKRTVSWIVS